MTIGPGEVAIVTNEALRRGFSLLVGEVVVRLLQGNRTACPI